MNKQFKKVINKALRKCVFRKIEDPGVWNCSWYICYNGGDERADPKNWGCQRPSSWESRLLWWACNL